ncbi:MAG TPA: hypothetical protein DHW42_04225 [Candidatus Marinimicrobia bacterium]|nr:hypothetical protein [Candidatus Neomarinimicrobiota bacterium]
MKDLNKKFSNKSLPTLCAGLSLGLILHGCSIISPFNREKSSEILSPYYVPVSSFPVQFKSISMDARIEIDTPDDDISLFANVLYQQIDTVKMQFKGPLRRKQAELDLTGNEYILWLQRRGKYYSGLKWPEFSSGYEIPDIPVEDLRYLLLGFPPPESAHPQIESAPKYQLSYDSHKRLTAIIVKNPAENQKFSVSYDGYKHIGHGIWLPTLIKISTAQNISIKIHYSRFRYELIKLI